MLDYVFTALYVVALAVFAFHFFMSIPMGRFRKKWIEGKWPEHDEPHPPALPKYIHFHGPRHLVQRLPRQPWFDDTAVPAALGRRRVYRLGAGQPQLRYRMPRGAPLVLAAGVAPTEKTDNKAPALERRGLRHLRARWPR